MIVGIVVSSFRVVVKRVLVIFGVIMVKFVFWLIVMDWKEFMMFYMVLNRLMNGVIELIVVSVGRLCLMCLSFFVIVMDIVWFRWFLMGKEFLLNL